ncbi:hypothetical protein B0H14DRAFT_2575882 [Mycena olivaceomarginata]|nr:hypothetical protein B0H14DRAFT_2575882 [Mycena olivaceomarginata]
MERREALGFKLDTYGFNIQDILAEYEFLEPYEQLVQLRLITLGDGIPLQFGIIAKHPIAKGEKIYELAGQLSKDSVDDQKQDITTHLSEMYAWDKSRRFWYFENTECAISITAYKDIACVPLIFSVTHTHQEGVQDQWEGRRTVSLNQDKESEFLGGLYIRAGDATIITAPGHNAALCVVDFLSSLFKNIASESRKIAKLGGEADDEGLAANEKQEGRRKTRKVRKCDERR